MAELARAEGPVFLELKQKPTPQSGLDLLEEDDSRLLLSTNPLSTKLSLVDADISRVGVDLQLRRAIADGSRSM